MNINARNVARSLSCYALSQADAQTKCQSCGTDQVKRLLSVVNAFSDGSSLGGNNQCGSCASGNCSVAVVTDEHRILPGKTVLITGLQRIGFALANALVQMDATIILLARDYENLKIAKSSILEKHPKAKVKIVAVDVTDEDSCTTLYEKFLRNHETPEILINCAGVARPGYVEELPLNVYRWTMDIDYHGTVNLVKFLLPDA